MQWSINAMEHKGKEAKVQQSVKTQISKNTKEPKEAQNQRMFYDVKRVKLEERILNQKHFVVTEEF